MTVSDADGDTIVARMWDFGDGASATGEEASHGFDTSGVYVIEASATDERGLTGRAQRIVTVGEPDQTIQVEVTAVVRVFEQQ